MQAPGNLTLIGERATMISWERSWVSHLASHWSLSWIGWRGSVEHLSRLPKALLWPRSWCSGGHVASRVMRAPLLTNCNPLLLLFEQQFSNTLPLSKPFLTVSQRNTLNLGAWHLWMGRNLARVLGSRSAVPSNSLILHVHSLRRLWSRSHRGLFKWVMDRCLIGSL